MKQNLLLPALMFALVLLASCGNDPKTDATTIAEGDSIPVDLGTFQFDTLKGIYAGDFGKSNLKLVISYASEGHATGYDIVKGAQRNISGKVTLQPETVELELSEPGDDKNDGIFYLSVNRKTLQMTGTWKPNNPKIKEKSFVLDRIVMPKDENELTAGNFAYRFGHVGDSLGDIYFDESGSCTYEYYTKAGAITGSATYENNQGNETKTDMGQLQEITGSWTFKKNKVIIEWEENDIFSSRKSTFDIFLNPDKDYDDGYLRGEGRELSWYNYW